MALPESDSRTAVAPARDLRLLVILPALNEAKTLGSVIAGIPKQIPGVSDVEVLVVDDGSLDATGDEAKRRTNVFIRQFRISRNELGRGTGMCWLPQ